MNYFVRVDGGIGRCIASTGAVAKFASTHKTSVVTSNPQVFQGLQNIDRIYPIGTPFLYEDKISQGIYLEPEPYNDVSYYAEGKHLSRVFNKLLNGCDENVTPEIHLTENELQGAKGFVNDQRHGKGFVLMQPFGGSGGQATGPDSTKSDESFRSFTLDFAKKLTDALISANYIVVWVKTPDQIGYEKAMTFNKSISIREIFALIPHCDGVICCDSFLHHASEALGNPVPAVVLWGGTDPKNLSYENQINIIPSGKAYYEPNRIPHDHAFYLDKNKGINSFSDELIPGIVAKMNLITSKKEDCKECKSKEN
jgi:ADP-heptose:LPS heptosyltransferase